MITFTKKIIEIPVKRVFVMFVLLFVTASVKAGNQPVLTVNLKGGLTGRFHLVCDEFKKRSGASQWCINYVQQTLGSTEFDSMQLNGAMQPDATDFRISAELLEFAQDQIQNKHLSGTVTKQVDDLITGCKREYILNWYSKNKFGDKGIIRILKTDTPVCLRVMLS